MNIIFDFDGTIADSSDLVYKNLKKFNPNIPQWNDLRGMSTQEVVLRVGLNPVNIAKMIWTIRNDFKNNLLLVPLIEGIHDVIQELSNHHSLYICTSNSKENVLNYLKLNKMKKLFKDVISLGSVFGKYRGLARWMLNNNIDTSTTVYVGDETRDIELAKKLGVYSWAVSWGYNNAKILQTYSPDNVFDNPANIFEATKSIC